MKDAGFCRVQGLEFGVRYQGPAVPNLDPES